MGGNDNENDIDNDLDIEIQAVRGELDKIENATPKNFRHTPEVENFYRFVYQNDLRKEAYVLLKVCSMAKTPSRGRRPSKKS